MIRPLFAAYPEHLVVDAGGWAERDNPDRPELRTQLLFEGMRELELQVANVAGRDLKLGPEALHRFVDSLGVQLVSANIKHDGRPYLRPWVLLRRHVGGREIGIAITGVTVDAHGAADAWPDSIQLEITDPVLAARQTLAELEPQSDIQVLLAYMPATELDRLASEMPGYELFVCGTGDLREATPPGAAPLVLAPGTKCKFLGWSALRVGEGNSVVQTAAGLEALDQKVADDPAMAARVVELKRRLGEAPMTDAAHVGATGQPVPPGSSATTAPAH
jgi:2',3'-cyclic-nucleotide 2'-phosphodiesterase (5'-nucleotidase family)